MCREHAQKRGEHGEETPCSKYAPARSQCHTLLCAESMHRKGVNMKITELLSRESISLNVQASDKKQAIEIAIGLMEKSGKITDKAAFYQKVMAREAEGSTGTGEGIAIPHGKGDMVKAPGLAALVIPGGVDFDSLDDEPVNLLFLIAAPNTEDNVHLDVLSRLSVLLMNDEFVGKLKNAKSVDEFVRIIDDTEKAEGQKEADVQTGHKFLAVTACPTGIAHTYMAAESLEKAAKAKGYSIKVETRGSGGAKNVVTAEEIEQAECIIIAADTKVPMDRFAGKRVIECQVSDGIGKAASLIERAENGDGYIYKTSGNEAANEKKTSGGTSVGHKIYMHLMSGVSHMLPFVVGGGILIAIAFLLDSMGVDLASLTADQRSNFGSITPAAAVFKTIGGAAFGFMLPVLAGYIAMSIADRPGLAVGFVAGALAASGKSGFLGALVAGFLAGYIILLLKKLFDKLPKNIEKLAPVLLYPFFGILIVGLLMVFVVEPPIGALNSALQDVLNSMGSTSKILLGIVVAGMMATDMGGPFNKAAYVFGLTSIASGNFDIMAAVMIGGMVPPCAIALSTILFKRKFTKEERESGPTNFIMGLAFITEGAIPYAAADPLRVIPACMIGSALAGALSMAFKCTLMAPHGGIFVFPVVGNALFYLLALAAGTIVGAFVLGVLKKRMA